MSTTLYDAYGCVNTRTVDVRGIVGVEPMALGGERQGPVAHPPQEGQRLPGASSPHGDGRMQDVVPTEPSLTVPVGRGAPGLPRARRSCCRPGPHVAAAGPQTLSPTPIAVPSMITASASPAIAAAAASPSLTICTATGCPRRSPRRPASRRASGTVPSDP